MGTEDIRWHQRFSSYKKAFAKLDKIILQIRAKYGNDIDIVDGDSFLFGFDIVKEGLIQRFEYTHELAWNVMKDYAFYQGNAEIGGSRDATREALQLMIIKNGEIWMEMIKSRNKTSHTYNEETANEIFTMIFDHYHEAFSLFVETMNNKLESDLKGNIG